MDNNLTLMTDLYQLTMMQGYFEANMHNKKAVFDMFYRKNPSNNGYAIACGLEQVVDYIKNINEEKSVEEEAHTNTLEDSMEEFVFMGLRMINGINICEFKERFNRNIYDVYAEVIKKHMDEELLANEKGNIYLTSKGIELSNYVMSDFILT